MMYDPVAKRILPYGYIYPFIETLLALMFFFRWHVEIALMLTILILGVNNDRSCSSFIE